MRQASKEEYKTGGEIARAMYQEFLKRPRWHPGLTNDERELAVSILMDMVTRETKLLTERVKEKTLPGIDNDITRIQVIHKLECLLRYGSNTELALYGYDN